jgi:hypothetical protein
MIYHALSKKKKEQTLSLNSEKRGKEDTNVYIDIPKEKDNKKMKKKKKETLTFNSAKVEKENKSTEDSDVDHDTPKKKDRKKMQNDHTLTVSSKKVETDYCISITKKSDMSITVICHAMSLTTVSVSLRRVIRLSQ